MGKSATRNILIIEDDREFVDDLLASWSPPGIVRRAASGKDAVQAIIRHSPDLILLDLTLPHFLAEVDAEEGFHLLSFIRKHLGLNTPVIVITRDGAREVEERVMVLGAQGFLRKPVAIAHLEEAVGGCMTGGESRSPPD